MRLKIVGNIFNYSSINEIMGETYECLMKIEAGFVKKSNSDYLYLVHIPNGPKNARRVHKTDSILYKSPRYNINLHSKGEYRWFREEEVEILPTYSNNKEAKLLLTEDVYNER